MSKVLKFQQNGENSEKKHMPDQDIPESINGDFMSYETIWQMTDGTSAETDSSMLDRMKVQYDAVLQKSKEIVNKAHADAEKIEKDAHQKGFEQGQKDGETLGRQRFEAVVQQFENLFQIMQKKSLQVDQVYQQNIIELIKVIVRRLVDHEISVNPDVIRSCLENALRYVVENAKVKIHLHPSDYKNFFEHGINIPGVLEGSSRLELVEDSSIAAGGCLLSSDYGDVDATVENRTGQLFEIVEQAFTKALNESPVKSKDDWDDSLL